MPKIAEIENTPNPNALKFILKEPLTWGIARSYDNAAQAAEDELAKIYAGKTSVQAGADAIAAAWEKITDQIGREKQIKLYRASLGL